MSQVCDICQKKPSVGHSVSHANNKTKRRWNINLQSVRAIVNGGAHRIRVCASCIRAGRVVKVPKNYASGGKSKASAA